MNMKMKAFTLMLVLICGIWSAGQAQYQLSNGGFEQWSGGKLVGWNSFESADGSMSGLASGTAPAQINESPSGTGSFCVLLTSTSIIGVIANGNLTTGRMHAGSMTPANAENYNYTDASNASYHHAFTGRPDSVIFWAKIDASNQSGTQARIHLTLHGNTNYKDPNDAGTSRIGHVEYNFSNPTKNQWVRYARPMVYDGTLSTQNPNFVLVSLTTNATPGGGSGGDKVYFDDIKMIYNTNLSSLKVNGTPIAGFSPNTTTYTLYYCQGTPKPKVTEATKASLANLLNPVIDSTSNPNATTITVTNGNEQKVYTVNFVKITPTLPLVTNSDVLQCGAGTVSLTVTPQGDATICRWYTIATGGTPFQSQNSFAAVFPDDTTVNYYLSSYHATYGCESDRQLLKVSTRPVPAVPVASNAERCGNGELTLTATAGINANTCRWYLATQPGVPLHTGNTYLTPSLYNTTNFAVSSYNSTSGCESAPINVAAIVHTPTTVSFDTTVCDLFAWAGETYNTSGIVTRVFKDRHDCDSTIHCLLTVHHTSAPFAILDTLCEGNSYNKYGFNVNVPRVGDTTISRHLLNPEGCDSVVTLLLHTKKIFETQIDTTICSGNLPCIVPYDNFVMTGAGVHDIIFTAHNGCDSIVHFTLHVLEGPGIPTVSGAEASCGATVASLLAYGASNASGYKWYSTMTGETLLHTGNTYEPQINQTTTFYASSYRESNGCESSRVPVKITINLKPGIPVVRDTAFCNSGRKTLSALPGVDGTICRWYTSATTQTIAATGNTYLTTNLPTPSSRDFYVSTYHELTGCESERATIHVTISTPPKNPVVSPYSLCGSGTATLQPDFSGNGNSVTGYWYLSALDTVPLFKGRVFTTPPLPVGNTTYTLLATDTLTGCESNPVNVPIAVFPTYDKDTTVTACTSFSWYGQLYTQSGEYNTMEQTAAGCDSNFHLSLTIIPPVTHTLPAMEVCGQHVWNDMTYTTTGNYEQTFTASNGCDSIVTLPLTIIPIDTNFITESQCDSYTWDDGITYTQSGIYTRAIVRAGQCDSIVTLILSIHESKQHEWTMTACGHYTWNNETYYHSGDYVKYFTTGYGCDSTVTLHLIVKPLSYENMEISLCRGDTYQDNNFYFPTMEAGMYKDSVVLTANNGCDSIVRLTLNVYPTYQPDTLRQWICANTAFNFMGKLLTEPGIYDTVVHTQHGCDSTVVLKLGIDVHKRTELRARICEGDSYVFANKVLTQPGFYSDTVYLPDLCDSITTLILTVSPKATWEITDEICQGTPYTLYGWNILTNNLLGDTTFEKHLPDAYGCDSTVFLHLTVTPAYQTVLDTITSCVSYQWYDNVYTESGMYVKQLYTEKGCDSVFVLPLIIYPQQEIDTIVCDNLVWNDTVFTATGDYLWQKTGPYGCEKSNLIHLVIHHSVIEEIKDTICEGNDYQKYGFQIFANNLSAGNHELQQTLTTGKQCDSIVKLYLCVQPVNTVAYHDTICTGEEYHEHGFDLPKQEYAGYFAHVYTQINEYGCMDTTRLMLTVNPAYQFSRNVTLCSNELPYPVGDSLFYESGTYVINMKTQQGCDSIVMLALTVNQSYSDTIVAAICEGDAYQFEDDYFDMPGTYVVEGTSMSGCDSNRVLVLSVNPVYPLLRDTLTICSTELPYSYAGKKLTRPGNHTINLKTVNGCDSIISLRLIVNEAPSGNEQIMICENQLPYTYGDSVFYKSGTYTVIFPASNGCDSTITLTLIVNPVYENIVIEKTACESFSWYGTTYTGSGIYSMTLPTANGCNCDSTIYLHLTVNKKSEVLYKDTICQYDTYQAHGFNLPAQKKTGTSVFVHEGTNAAGCDSSCTLQLFVKQSPHFIMPVEACEQFEWQGTLYTQSGAYTVNYPKNNGCDSAITLLLTIRQPSPVTYITEEICQYETFAHPYLRPDTRYPGQQIDSLWLPNAAGCDSLVVLILQVNEIKDHEIFDTICLGTPYFANDFSIPAHAEAGTFEYVRETVNTKNCHEEIILTLTVLPVIHTEITATSCGYFAWNDTLFTQSGVYPQHFVADNGCDSTVTLHLTVFPAPEALVIQDTICQHTIYDKEGFWIVEAPVGMYTDTIRLRDQNKCDSLIILNLMVHASPWIVLRDTITPDTIYNENGFYIASTRQGIMRDTLFLQTEHGCDSTVQLILYVMPKQSGIALTRNSNSNLHLYPNPANNILFVEWNTETKKQIQEMEIYDMLGNRQRLTRVNVSSKIWQVDVSELPTGIYLLKIGNHISKFVKI
jgi:hypothetical protein